MPRRLVSVAASLSLAVGLVPAAGPARAATVGAPTPAGTAEGMLAALHRDLGLNPDRARRHIAAGENAATVESDLRQRIGAHFGGVWLDDSGRLVAAVTDRNSLATATAAGARARLVAHSEATLAATAARLDRATRPAPDQVTGWYADIPSNSVVVRSAPGARDAAGVFAAAAGADPATIRVIASTEVPTPLANVRGGDPYYTSTGARRCSVAFTVVDGFLTAGHCGRAGDLVYAANGEVMGFFQASSYPVNDYAWVRLRPGWTPVGQVRTGPATYVPIHGAVSAPIGATTCRYGNTTGWRCGRILAKNQTVNYAQGVVSGLTRTNVCAEPGDSGGPFVSGNQAQGSTSGGSGNCASGGTTFFQPVAEPLAALGLTLLTSP